jgi:hypothetical protein
MRRSAFVWGQPVVLGTYRAYFVNCLFYKLSQLPVINYLLGRTFHDILIHMNPNISFLRAAGSSGRGMQGVAPEQATVTTPHRQASSTSTLSYMYLQELSQQSRWEGA